MAGEEYGHRVCIKIPATWEGLQACSRLEARGCKTLATTMFCMEQAALAAEMNCTYIAPYVNELRVHFDKEFVTVLCFQPPGKHTNKETDTRMNTKLFNFAPTPKITINRYRLKRKFWWRLSHPSTRSCSWLAQTTSQYLHSCCNS